MLLLPCRLQIPNDNVFQAYHAAVLYSMDTDGPAIKTCTSLGFNPSSVCAGNFNATYGCLLTTAASSNATDLEAAAQKLLDMYPKALTWTLAGGATTEATLTLIVPGCNVDSAPANSMFVCSHITPRGANFGIEYPFWVAQSWMYRRFIQYDMRASANAPAGLFGFTDMNDDGCGEFAT
jgi:hypothetical protein